jgi:hypothetical protein
MTNKEFSIIDAPISFDSTHATAWAFGADHGWKACAEQYEVRLKKLENALDNTVRQRDGWKEHVEELKLDIKELKNKLIEYEG